MSHSESMNYISLLRAVSPFEEMPETCLISKQPPAGRRIYLWTIGRKKDQERHTNAVTCSAIQVGMRPRALDRSCTVSVESMFFSRLKSSAARSRPHHVIT